MATSTEAETSARGQAEIWRFMFGFIDSLALKCVIELQIPNIINSHGGPITLSQLASRIDSPSVEISYLERIMRLLARRNVFTVDQPSDGDGDEPIYGLTHVSKWLVKGSDTDMSPLYLIETHAYVVNSWHLIGQSVKEGGLAYEKAHGRRVSDTMVQDDAFRKIFCDGMACMGKILISEILRGYKDGFEGLGSLVDVGGGIGGMISEIVKFYPNIKAINFDLPHVIAIAPVYDGVTHVAGDMFHQIPKADALLLKWILHEWDDGDCARVLRNCREAIPEENGKVIIVDVVLQPDGNGLFDDTGFAFDVHMMVNRTGAKERTELQWKKILEEGGFPRYKIVEIPALQSIIEAYPI